MTNQRQYFRIKNFERFQHYKNRRPSWIKFYNSLLTDMEFNSLTEVQQLHLLKLWLLASQNKNRLIFDSQTIRKRLGLDSRLSLEVFVKAGFIEIIEDTEKNASTALVSNKEVEEYKQEPPLTPPRGGMVLVWFEKIWEKYPNKDGKKAALRHFKATVQTDHHWQQIQTALENYKAQIEYDRARKDGYNRQYKSGSTWFNNWPDWVDWQLPEQAQNRQPNPSETDQLDKINKQIVHLKDMLGEPDFEITYSFFYMAIEKRVLAFESEFKRDPLSPEHREWFDRLKLKIQMEERAEFEMEDEFVTA